MRAGPWSKPTRNQRDVRLGHPEAGTTDLYASLASRDAEALNSTISTIARAMAAAGDGRSREQRRAAALGVLADPAEALEWLNGTPTGRKRGRSIVHIHLDATTITQDSTGIARIEGYGPLTTASLPELLQSSHTSIRPVIDDARHRPVDAYEIPERIRFAVQRRHVVENFPAATRSSKGLDLDHITRYNIHEKWNTGQTSVDNLQPLTRLVHRAKTAGAWHVTKTSYGHFVWRSPLSREYHINLDGTSPPPMAMLRR